MKRVFVLLVMLLMLGMGALPARGIMGDEPTIVSVVPGEAAPGQVFTVQCFACLDPAHPELTEVRLTEALTGKTVVTQVLTGPTSREFLYVQVPAGLAGGTWKVRIKTLDDQLVSDDPWGLRIRSKPGTPIPTGVIDITFGGAHLTEVRRGQIVGIPAYGLTTDSNSVLAQWIQLLAEPRPDPIIALSSSPALGMVALAVVPNDLQLGTALVQLRVRIAGVNSDLSFALRVQVIE